MVEDINPAEGINLAFSLGGMGTAISTITPSSTITAKPIETQDERFIPMYHTPGINSLNNIIDTKKTETKANYNNEIIYKLTHGELKIQEGRVFKTSTKKLLDFILCLFTYQNSHIEDVLKCDISFNKNKYLEIIGITSTAMRKKALKTLTEDLLTLRDAKINITDKIGKKTITANANIFITDIIITDTGRLIDKINLTVHPEIANHLHKQGFVMKYNKILFQLEEKNPNLYPVAYKLQFLNGYYKNQLNDRANIISIKNLLKETTLPSRETVMQGDRAINRKIIEPLENSLEKLVDAGFLSEFNYCNAKGNILKDDIEELRNRIKKDFFDLYIYFKPNDTPREKDTQLKTYQEKVKKREKIKPQSKRTIKN
jgi:hypothetical protein